MLSTPARRRIWGFACVALATVGLLVPTAVAVGQQEPVVTAAVQVTNNPNPSRAYTSPALAVNPKTGELVIVTTDMRARKTCEVFISANDGRSWFEGGSPALEPFTDCGSEAISSLMFTLTFDSNGVLYLAFTANDPKLADRPDERKPRHVFLARSTDSGRSWETTFVFEAPATSQTGKTDNSRPMVAVDPSDSSHVYVSWNQDGGPDKPNKALVAASDDGGRTFGEPVNIGGKHGAYQARIAVGPNGAVHAAIPERGFPFDSEPPLIRSLNYRGSTDHGQTWSQPTQIDQGNAGFTFARKWGLAVDPETGTLYVVWYGNPDPRASRPADDRDIYLRVSTDGGETWSDRQMVNDEANHENVQHYDPNLSIAPNGRLDIAWLDFRNSPVPEQDADGPPFNHGGFQDVYYSSSTDQGRTLNPNLRITDRLIDRSIGVWSNNIHSHAPVGIASTNDSVYFAWQDTRNGDPVAQSEDIYFASLKLNGAAPLGASILPGLGFWGLLAAVFVFGAGLAMAVTASMSRRSRGRTVER